MVGTGYRGISPKPPMAHFNKRRANAYRSQMRSLQRYRRSARERAKARQANLSAEVQGVQRQGQGVVDIRDGQRLVFGSTRYFALTLSTADMAECLGERNQLRPCTTGQGQPFSR